MPFQVSPGVNVSEVDLTTVIPAVSTTEGALAGHFQWGPVGERVLIDSEDTLVNTFRKPDTDTATDFFTAANFLAYSNKLYVVRTNSTGALNADSLGVGQSVLSTEDYEENHAGGVTGAGDWVAKYPGDLGNTLKVSICQSAAAWETLVSTTLEFTADSTSVTAGADVDLELAVGDLLTLTNSTTNISLQVASVAATDITVTKAPTSDQLGGSTLTTDADTVKRTWEYYNVVDNVPGTSPFAAGKGGANDELHVVIVDEDGTWTGVQGTVLEVYQNVSRASDAKTTDGATNYYKNVINNQSKTIWWGNHNAHLTDAGGLSTVTYANGTASPITGSLTAGNNGSLATEAEYINAYNQFQSSEDVDVSLILGSGCDQVVATHLINNIAESRKDCIVCLSPRRADVVNNSVYPGAEADSIIEYRDTLPSSSYATMDSGWKYQYDKYNDIYRHVPLNGDVGGLMVRTDSTRDPWWSPAGFNRGNVKNVVKLSYNPIKSHRDSLFKKGVNPVVTFPGQGTVLFGDKTLLAQPSAFDRINVRRLFIVLEKAIATASKFTLFEFNDDFTRAQFRNLVEPFLRDVQGRRGIHDFKVVCDTTNNTGEVIDRNEFIGDIYIKPARSINFIQLNFVAVRTGIEFEEVVGKF